ncbi:MAG: CAAX prenyl protease-related protein [Pirellulales bacterium]|nr:CAAX prenyl protease-related protein [Pirellulales bacterium]
MPNSKRVSPWFVCLLPFVLFMALTSFEPNPPAADGSKAPTPWYGISIDYKYYPYTYTVKILATAVAMVLVWPGYLQYPRRLTWLAVIVGVIGVALWIGLAQLQRFFTDDSSIEWLKSLGSRSAYNPLKHLHDRPALAYGFLLIRFIGLVVVVPVIEEFFLRAFLMRYVQTERWWEVPFGKVTPLAVVVGTAVPMLMHPQELLAALAWFSGVTWLMTRTRSIGDCILAHAITNLLMGLYVVFSGQWWLM